MKKLRFKIIIAATLILATAIVACKKSFLDKAALGSLDQNILATNTGVQGLLIGAYSLVDGAGTSGDGISSAASNWVFGGISSDDAYKGSDPSDGGADWLLMETHSQTPTTPSVSNKWNLCYHAIQRCNDVLRTMKLAKDISATDQKTIAGEARFLRAFFHFEAKRIYNNVPYIDESVTLDNPTADVSNSKDIYPQIEADFQFAIDNLPETQSAAGRANKWAATAYLGKVLLYEHKYAAALPLFTSAINNGKTSNGKKYDLLPNYFSNFNPAQKNSQESVWAAQESVLDNSSIAWGGDPNGNFGDILNFPYNGGPGGCCGFYNPSDDLAKAYKTDANGLPLLDTWYTGASVNTLVPYAGSLDPRIDVAAGRPGIPYLDWGKHPGDDWIRNPGADGHLSPKKNVYALQQKGTYSDVSSYWAPTELTANNVNLMRFADVLLMAAECEVEAGSTVNALTYVNRIRTRAANPTTWTYMYPKDGAGKDITTDFDPATYTYKTQTTPAGNYNIGLYTAAQFADQAFARKAVRFERRLELSMEGHRFFDLVRYDNGTGSAADVLNAFNQRDAAFVPYLKSSTFVKGKHEYYPIPQDQLDVLNQNGKVILKQNPGY